MIPTRALLAMIFTILGLLVVVIFVGLFQGKLDPQGVALTLSSVFSGLVLGALAKERSDKNKQDPPAEKKEEADA